MRPGQLDQRIAFMREQRVQDDQGGFARSRVEFASAWAWVKPLSGSESEDYDRVNATHTYVFVVRNRQDILESDQIEWLGVSYNIRQIARRSNRRMYVDIIAERGVA